MPKGYPLTECRHCHQPIRRRSELSASGLHPWCGEAILRENVTQLIAHRGPRFEHWRQRCIAAFTSPRLSQPQPER